MASSRYIRIPQTAVGQRNGERRDPRGRLLLLSSAASLMRRLDLALRTRCEERWASNPAINSVVESPIDLARSTSTRSVGLASPRSRRLTYVRSIDASNASSDCDLLAAILACLRLSPNAIAIGCRSDAFLRLRVVTSFWVIAIDAKMRQCRLNYDGVNTALLCENIYCRINAAKNFVNYSRPNRDDFKIKNIVKIASPTITSHFLKNKGESN